jgi:hypothetical protein
MSVAALLLVGLCTIVAAVFLSMYLLLLHCYSAALTTTAATTTAHTLHTGHVNDHIQVRKENKQFNCSSVDQFVVREASKIHLLNSLH